MVTTAQHCRHYAQGGRRQESGERRGDCLGNAVQEVPQVAEGVHKRLEDPHGDDAPRRRIGRTTR